MTLGETLLSELDGRRKRVHWDYSTRQYLRSVDSTDLLADFLKSHGLGIVPVSDDIVRVADGIFAVQGAQACQHFMRKGLFDLLLAVVFIAIGYRNSGVTLIIALALGVLFILLGVGHFRMIRYLRLELQKYSVPPT